MRIVAGTHRGRIVTPPPGFKARPTTDFAKENLFNSLSNLFDWEEVSFLDLFSGTGSLSYEAASRGAHRVLSVEGNALHQRFIVSTIKSLGFKTITSIRSNVFTFLKSSFAESFDVIFADPPYDMEALDTVPDLVLEKGILSEGGTLIFEHSSEFDFSAHPRFVSMKKYGSVHFSLFE
ncbi:MAG: RsmD family RNA methyltransferase [Rikenellaceae bacterium]